MLNNNSSTFENAKNLKLLIDLNLLQYLERTEPLNFELYRVKLRKALRLTLTEFKAIYSAYKLMRGAV